MGNFIVRNLRHYRVMLFCEKKDMARICGVYIKDCRNIAIFINLLCLYFACHYLAENALLFLELLQLFRRHLLYLFLQFPQLLLTYLLCHICVFLIRYYKFVAQQKKQHFPFLHFFSKGLSLQFWYKSPLFPHLVK